MAIMIQIDFIILMWSYIGTIGMMFIIMIMLNPLLKLKILRIVKRAPYGLGYFMSADNTLFMRCIRFDKDEFSTKDGGIWIIEDSHIYKQADGIQSKKELVISNQLGGFPVIYWHLRDMLPMSFDRAKLSQMRNPQQIQAIISKIREAAKLEALQTTKDKLRTMIIVTLLFAFVAATLSFMAFNSANSAVDMLKIMVPASG